MSDADRIRVLLAAASEPAGDPIKAPVAQLLHRARAGRRRRGSALVVAMFAVTAAVIAVPVAILGRPEVGPVALPGYAVPSVSSYPTAGPGSAAALAQGHWTRLPDAPIAGRGGAATVWTGQQMLVWGGSRPDDEPPYFDDGAAFDPSSQSWHALPTGPLAARYAMASVWTGHEMFIWGGYDRYDGVHAHAAADGGLYDPDTLTWRRVADAPLSARVGAVALWTGHEVLVLGGWPANRTEQHQSDIDGAAYDPGTDRWRQLPAIPTGPDQVVVGLDAVATTQGVYAWVYWQQSFTAGSGSGEYHAGVLLMRYDPDDGAWHRINSQTDTANLAGVPLWTGREIILPAAEPFYGTIPHPRPMNLNGWRMDPTTHTWRAMTHGPVDDLRADSVWTGAALLSFNSGSKTDGPDGTTYPGVAAVWDPYADKWTRLPDAPFASLGPVNAVWTGNQLLEWGQMATGKDIANGPGNVTGIGLSFGR